MRTKQERRDANDARDFQEVMRRRIRGEIAERMRELVQTHDRLTGDAEGQAHARHALVAAAADAVLDVLDQLHAAREGEGEGER